MMVSAHNPEQYTRAMMLAGSLRQIRGETDRLGAGDVIHQLRNVVLTAQGALSIAERRLSQGRNDDVDTLLDLAERQLRDGRALVARMRSTRFTRRRPAAQAA